ncbi:hypothetical protein [Streptomyces sp. NBC_01233]|uniref:hypothetical protein n=1 Tax=Streptomyces sp. NBC_01233 TaxID=2903787 RepID=UPI002E15F99F|nr:hypothetical protein OG332_45645 [Streptomyces sp. NBC_01233]
MYSHVPADPPAELVAARLRDPYPYFAWLRRYAPAHVERRAAGPRCGRSPAMRTYGPC